MLSLHAIGFMLLIAGFWLGVGALAMGVVGLTSAVSYFKRDRPDGPSFVVRAVLVE